MLKNKKILKVNLIIFYNKLLSIVKNEYFRFSIFTFLAFIAPSVLYSLFYTSYKIRVFDPLFFSSFFIFSIFLAFSKTWLDVSVLVLFCLMELVNFGHIFYFGTPITPFEISLMWKESGEIMESSLDTFPECFIFILCVLIPYIAIIYAYLKKRSKKGSWIATLIALYILSIYPRKAYRRGDQALNNFMPRNDMVSIYNSLSSFSFYFFNIARKGKNVNVVPYKEYIAKKVPSLENVNIVILLGESINPSRMSLFGYERDTTPYLKKLAREDKNFIYKLGFSSSVLTTVATTMFFNVQREPNNIMHTAKQTTHLFKLAKENNFTTAYISAQNSLITRGMAPNYVDIWHVADLAPLLVEKRSDFSILDKLNEFKDKFGKKNFIVLHQRSPHSPYNVRYENFPQFDKWNTDTLSREVKIRDTYDNAMAFTDYFMYEVIEWLKKNTKNPTYIIWVPDHSELLGEDGIWGHTVVNINVAKIPFFATLINSNDTDFIKKFKNLFQPTHYEISKMVAKLLGYEIVNPNEKDGIFYVNGNIISGDAGWFELDKSNGKEVKIERKYPN